MNGARPNKYNERKLNIERRNERRAPKICFKEVIPNAKMNWTEKWKLWDRFSGCVIKFSFSSQPGFNFNFYFHLNSSPFWLLLKLTLTLYLKLTLISTQTHFDFFSNWFRPHLNSSLTYNNFSLSWLQPYLKLTLILTQIYFHLSSSWSCLASNLPWFPLKLLRLLP